MRISEISERDGQSIVSLHKLLKKIISEMKFSLADAKVVDEAFRWFQVFVTQAAQVQKMETDNKEPEKPEDKSGLKIKDYNPGDLSVVSGGKKTARKTARKKK